MTLDGQRNDGTAGQNALVGSDIENAGIGDTSSSPTDDVLVGNDGPNVLMGPGTVRGLGGNDTLITNNIQGAGTTLDGGDGDDRIDALSYDSASGKLCHYGGERRLRRWFRCRLHEHSRARGLRARQRRHARPRRPIDRPQGRRPRASAATTRTAASSPG